MAGLLLLCLAPAASAASSHEELERVVTLRTGNEIHFLKRYVDDTIFPETVKLILRDANGARLAETAPGRDVGVSCWNPDSCLVFRYEGMMPLAPAEVWSVRERGLVPRDSFWLFLLGGFAPLWSHSLGHLSAVMLFFVPFAIEVPARRWRRRWLYSAVRAGTPVYLLLWVYALVALTVLSLPLTLLAIGVLTLLTSDKPRPPSPDDYLDHLFLA